MYAQFHVDACKCCRASTCRWSGGNEIEAVTENCFFVLSLPSGWMLWYLCSAWRMRSASRLCTATMPKWLITEIQRRFPWYWSGHKVGYRTVIWPFRAIYTVHVHIHEWVRCYITAVILVCMYLYLICNRHMYIFLLWLVFLSCFASADAWKCQCKSCPMLDVNVVLSGLQ